jgi:soluble lytic murein transglycosylase-like protein
MRASLGLLGLLLNGPALATDRPSGTVLPVAPTEAPGGMSDPDADPVHDARVWFLQGDMTRVVALLTPHLAHQREPVKREESSAHLMLGLAHRSLENWNLAAAHFWWVRTSAQPLAPFGAWYEAEAELVRGQPKGAIEVCTLLREQWPKHRRADECLLIMGDAWADAGDGSQSKVKFDAWLDTHRSSPRTEAIRLRAALARARVDPKSVIRTLQRLSLDHHYHSTAVSAERALQALAEQGFENKPPQGTRVDIRRIESAQRCGRLDEAWKGFLALAARADDDPAALRWIDANEMRVAKKARQWEVLAQLYEAQYQERTSGATAWKVFSAWSRAGDWTRAVEWGRKGLSAHGGRGRWASAADDVAWAEIHLGDFKAASERWTALATGRGTFGRNAQFYSAFSAFRSADMKAAERGFAKVIDYGRSYAAKGHYWRAKAREALGNGAGAAADREQAIAMDKTGWYTALLDEDGPTPADGGDEWLDRDGRFKRAALVTLPQFRAPTVVAADATGMGRGNVVDLLPTATVPSWSQVAWPLPTTSLPPVREGVGELVSISGTVPDGYHPSQWFDMRTSSKRLQAFAEANKDRWPDLPAAHDLAVAGLVSEAARVVGKAYKDWRRSGRQARSSTKGGTTVKGTIHDWRQFFVLSRDHYHVAQSAIGLDRKVTEIEAIRSARQLAYPIVNGPDMWALGEEFGVDPLLMMSIMRQESTYRHAIKSRAGAVGLVQVMPATGARLAWLMGDESYSPGALEDPAVNVRYGTYYLSLLIDRFDGVFPMAVASYNGGPHNVSRWYRAHQHKIEIDEWAEQIPWRETRDYVKKVMGHYAQYTTLYGPDGARVRLPRKPVGDDAGVVNF